MKNNLIHPALLQLLRCQVRARIRKIVNSFRSPRRQFVSILAIVFAVIWLGQAIAGILFRESANPERLATWIPLGFFAYTAWHLIKTISSKPVEPFEWTPAELELLCGAPLKRRHLIVYRFASILSSAILKSLCFTLLMLPDLNILVSGFYGMLIGLILVDLIRLLIEQVCRLFTKRGLKLLRGVVYASLVLWIGSTFWICFTASSAQSNLASPAALLFAKSLGQELVEHLTVHGAFLLLPFQSSVGLILATDLDLQLLAHFLIGTGLVAILLSTLIALDDLVLKMTRQREFRVIIGRKKPSDVCSHSKLIDSKSEARPIRVPFRIRGVGSIAWRQLLGAWHYRTTLAVSLGVPTLLCCLPLLASHEPLPMLLNVVAGIVFYSFLLLPSALMLDFRRDVHRLDVLKSLPINPMAVTLGQLAAPIALCMAFQWIVLIIASVNGSVSLWQASIAATLLIPINVLIFAVENVLFMIAPYRRNQEGVAVFLRTILTFTAKGMLFAIGLAITVAWAFVCRQMGANYIHGQFIAGLMFGAGIWFLTSLAAASMTVWLARMYREFDPSLDAPNLS